MSDSKTNGLIRLGQEYKTVSGDTARIVCVDNFDNKTHPVIAIVNGQPETYTAYGKYDCDHPSCANQKDLVVVHHQVLRCADGTVVHVTDAEQAKQIDAVLDGMPVSAKEAQDWISEVRSRIPEGYKYAAMDRNGEWYAFKSKPTPGGELTTPVWVVPGYVPYRLGTMPNLVGVPVWHETLITAQPEAKQMDWISEVRSRIPEGYKYAAMDSCGIWYVYKSKPKPGVGRVSPVWVEANGMPCRLGTMPNLVGVPVWHETLITAQMDWMAKVRSLIPEGYVCAAMDRSGEWYAYRSKPGKSDTLWSPGSLGHHRIGYLKVLVDVPHWSDTLVFK